MRQAGSTNDPYADITRAVIDECEGTIDDFVENGITGDVVVLPHRLICATSTMSDAATDLTVRLWDDAAYVVIYRDWVPDSALVGTVGYGPKFATNLRMLIKHVDQRLQTIQDPEEAIDSLVAE